MYPTQLARMSFDEILDLTADVFSFYNIEAFVRKSYQHEKCGDGRGCRARHNTLDKVYRKFDI